MKILLAEDDSQTAAYLRQGLSAEGYSVDHVPDGRDALVQATLQTYDLLVIDRMMPGLDGLSLVKALRSAQVKAPILILTAMGGVTDRVEGLQAGADDYLVKPFAFSELSARLAALARRPALAETGRDVLRVGDLTLDTTRRTATRGGVEIDLQPREFRLLEHLMRSAGRVQTRTMLLEAVWDFHFDPGTSVVETHISRLRAKIDRPFEKPLLHTVRGAGYMLKA
ncbi:response regulator transcription factor [Cereibacter azotoformans]|uniref:Two-component system OmpR family response regulator n=1 Tax=Cereibacter azotoformans TaxID=43057 RepID=A0A2T5K6F5_9RHOB|nr:response regulator transcription factor [Cereibacter azotoformans]AXQ95878.1 DNA-binding response regulator [Cereibacter sphaeroides]PTR18003.1 two-component system OmpR family response regulator [Cereibacter azotoformans]UIJ32608.1 response regulator transcription factor [Cereibacter azotoformans]